MNIAKGGVFMFEKGEKIIYGQTGVCIVEEICEREFIKNQKQMYYVLRPLGLFNNVIYAPIEGGKVFMRRVISRVQAETLIESIPKIINSIPDKEITKDEYAEMINAHSLEELVTLTAIIYSKRLNVLKLNKRLNNVDEKYLKIGENLLFGELSAVLEIELDKVHEYIENKIGK